MSDARKVDDIYWCDEPALLIHGDVTDDEAALLFVEFYGDEDSADFQPGIDFDGGVELGFKRGWFRKRPPLPYEWCNGYSTIIQEATGPAPGAFHAVLVGLDVS